MNESKKNYDIHYVKTKCKQYTLLLSKENDKDIIEFLESLPNRNGFLKSLIRDYISNDVLISDKM